MLAGNVSVSRSHMLFYLRTGGGGVGTGRHVSFNLRTGAGEGGRHVSFNLKKG